MKYVEKDGKRIYYKIIVKPIKHTYFRLKKGYLQITTQPRVQEKTLIELIETHFDRYYERIQQKEQVFVSNEINLWGKTYSFEVRKGLFTYHIGASHIIAYEPNESPVDARMKLYVQEMKQALEQIDRDIVKQLAALGIPLLPYRLAFLRSKFGSYHRGKRQITLNTFLASLDPIYLTYVIYHEYAHYQVFNHSKEFYQLLDQLIENHRSIQKSLKKMVIY
ncbi:MAG: YgjP-like metallopeptidase domain-containing protein [Acholeplasmataceae bacterium]|nr:M48 family metallopeptidase [Acholeplasmataceae bacterium]